MTARLLAALWIAGAGPVSAQTRLDLGAALEGGYTDNSTGEDFTTEDPFPEGRRPSAIMGLVASAAVVTERAAGHQLVAVRFRESLYLDEEARDTTELDGRFAIDHTAAGWDLAAGLRLRAGAFGRFEPDEIVGPVRRFSGGRGMIGGGFALARLVSARARVFNEVHAGFHGSSGFILIVRDEVGAQLALGREAFELRAIATSAGRPSSSTIPMAYEVGFGGLASWRHDLGGGFSTLVSAGATSGWRKGRHVAVAPTGRARLSSRRGDGHAMVEAARTVKLDTLVGGTFVVSEAIAAGSYHFGALVVAGEGGVGRFDPWSDLARRAVVARAVARAGWRFTRFVTIAAEYQLFHQDDDRIVRHHTFLLSFEAGTLVAPAAHHELISLVEPRVRALHSPVPCASPAPSLFP
jgi:hypothetical protein